ncbi:hypothetical protein ACRZCT_003507, partial [Aeromonas hydrophila]
LVVPSGRLAVTGQKITVSQPSLQQRDGRFYCQSAHIFLFCSLSLMGLPPNFSITETIQLLQKQETRG